MAVRIRMQMLGRKHRPYYRICVMDSKKHRDSPEIEQVGTYDTMIAVKADRVKLNLERIDYWISVGAKPSEKVAVLIKKVRTNRFGTAQPAPAAIAPKELPQPAQPEGGEAAEAPAESSEG